MATHKMHLGLDDTDGLVLLCRSVHCEPLRQSIHRNRRSIQSHQREWKMTHFEYIGHKFLFYALIIPPILMVALGMFCGGSIIYAERKVENAKFVYQLIQDDMQTLSEMNI